MNTKLFFRRNIQLNRCPYCNEIATLRRSRSRNIFEKILKKLKYAPYVCRNCGWRGKIFSYKIARNFLQLVILYAFIIIFAVYIVKKFLSKYFD